LKISLTDFKTYYKVTLIKALRYWPKDRQTEQWTMIELRNELSHICQMTLDKAAKTTQWGKDSLFSKWCWDNWIPTNKRINVDLYPAPY